MLSLGAALLFLVGPMLQAQETTPVPWIRPDSPSDHPLWGIKGGMVIGLWPTPIENKNNGGTGGPRGLFRMGYQFGGRIYQMNFIAVEPVVDGKMEFSEISPSRVDGKWGKLMWAGEQPESNSYTPFAGTRGVISHPDPDNPEVEELSFYVFIEKFLNGAHPYFKLSIRSDRPEEIGFQIFNHVDSAEMERCVLTATMGNYGRLRNLHLKEEVVDSRELYKGYEDIHFIEKETYPLEELYKTGNGDILAIAETNETFSELASWPQRDIYFSRAHWRYRPFYQVAHYWRKDAGDYDSSLRLRVNGRATYWAGGSNDKKNYMPIPGGPAFENFEFREDYTPGQKFYFGLTRTPVEAILKGDY